MTRPIRYAVQSVDPTEGKRTVAAAPRRTIYYTPLRRQKILLSERDENAQGVRRGQHLLASLKPGSLQRPPPPILSAEDDNAVHRVPEYHRQGGRERRGPAGARVGRLEPVGVAVEGVARGHRRYRRRVQGRDRHLHGRLARMGWKCTVGDGEQRLFVGGRNLRRLRSLRAQDDGAGSRRGRLVVPGAVERRADPSVRRNRRQAVVEDTAARRPGEGHDADIEERDGKAPGETPAMRVRAGPPKPPQPDEHRGQRGARLYHRRGGSGSVSMNTRRALAAIRVARAARSVPRSSAKARAVSTTYEGSHRRPRCG